MTVYERTQPMRSAPQALPILAVDEPLIFEVTVSIYGYDRNPRTAKSSARNLRA